MTGSSATFHAAHQAAEQGDLTAARAVLEASATTTAERAFRRAVAAELALRDGDVEPPTIDEARALAAPDAAPEARLAAARIAGALGRLAALRFDVDGVSAAIEAQGAAAREDPASELDGALLRGWERWLDPDRGVVPDLEAVYRRAHEVGLAGRAVEAQILRALHVLAGGTVEGATEIARRASRMARTEAIPLTEIVANVALARVRRHQNRPHQARAILSTLGAHAPPSCRAWMAWEAQLSGARGASGLAGDAGGLRALHEAIAEARLEDARALARALLASTVARPLAIDARRVVALWLGEETDVGFDDLTAWREGTRAPPPAGLAGLVFPTDEADALEPMARVLVLPRGRARRVAHVCTELVGRIHGADTAPLEGPLQPRADAGLAMLAFRHGAPISTEDYVQALYGYPYEAGIHGSMLRMHLTRMRRRLGGLGDVMRDGDDLRLVMERPALLRDPTCEEDFAQRVLRALAARPGSSAKDVARAVNAPLRSVQRALSHLVTGGETVAEKEGRVVVYRVEDTTFSEPTRSRRFEPT